MQVAYHHGLVLRESDSNTKENEPYSYSDLEA